MTLFRSSVAALTAVALLAGSSLAFAEPHHDEHHHRDRDRDQHHRPAPPPPRHPGVRSAPPGTIALAKRVQEEHKWGQAEKRRADAWRKAYLAQRARDRAHRRAEEQAKLKKKWARDKWVWNHAEVKSEMDLDAWRLARIAALIDLATHEKRLDLVARLNDLRAREIARHNHRMDGYRARWGHR